jgi:hypothetical protein
MIIFSTAGGGVGGLTVGRGLLGAAGGPSVTTFRNNAYIHRLNRTLQAEMRAIAAYRAFMKGAEAEIEGVAANGGEHQLAGRELVRLIIANRGIPEDRSALDLGLTPAFIRIFSGIFARATLGTLEALERRLVEQYQKLRKEAPACDAGALAELERQTAKHLEVLADLKG